MLDGLKHVNVKNLQKNLRNEEGGKHFFMALLEERGNCLPEMPDMFVCMPG